ncbi:MAG: amidinotransferase [Flavobacteriales bacterium]|nr:amidinotransferase [Flavobacteriales bacterium]
MMQTTNTLLMIRPVNFNFNEETAQNNFYQKRPIDNNYSSLMAVKEFDNFVNILRNHGVNVVVFEDIIENKTPDSIFPNNWISTHLEGSVILYPMFAENRRRERREDIIDYLNKNFLVNKLYKEYLSYEKEGFYLEGTGSMVLDRVNKIAYASISRRTDFILFHEWCELMNYKPVPFISYQNISGSKEVIYHTNVMMCIASKFAIICLESINNTDDKKKVEQTLINSGKEVILITETQKNKFAGNMLEVLGDKNYLVMSQTAFLSLSDFQKERIMNYAEIVSVPIENIEKIGGGSVRCMMAEIFLQKK